MRGALLFFSILHGRRPIFLPRTYGLLHLDSLKWTLARQTRREQKSGSSPARPSPNLGRQICPALSLSLSLSLFEICQYVHGTCHFEFSSWDSRCGSREYSIRADWVRGGPDHKFQLRGKKKNKREKTLRKNGGSVRTRCSSVCLRLVMYAKTGAKRPGWDTFRACSKGLSSKRRRMDEGRERKSLFYSRDSLGSHNVAKCRRVYTNVANCNLLSHPSARTLSSHTWILHHNILSQKDVLNFFP